MITYEQYAKIKHYHEGEGLNASQIAARLGLHPVTVTKWLARKHYKHRSRAPRSSKLDPYKRSIVRLLETHPYSAAQVFQRIREEGFEGGYTIVKDYVRKVRPRQLKAFLKLSFAPGECAQVDWGSYGSVKVGSTRRRLSFFVMVLCYSRMMYVEFSVSQAMEFFLGAHVNAFRAFTGIPEKIMVDNLKCAVLKRLIGQAPVFNPRYLDFAGHYGFKIVPCAVGKGNEKGRVENAVGYVKKNFLNGLDIPDFSALNPALGQWLENIANVRIHGATRKRPVDLFEQEKSSLRPVPAHPYDIARVIQVRASRQFRITLDTNKYSVPAQYAGRPLTLKAYPDRLHIYDEQNLIARHPRSFDRHRDFEDPDHPKELLCQRRKARDQKLFARFLMLCDRADEFYQQLRTRRMNPRHHVAKIVALSDIYGPEAVSRALRDAFVFQAFSSEYILNILEQRSRKMPEPGPLHLTRGQDMLDLQIRQPDLDLYSKPRGRKP